MKYHMQCGTLPLEHELAFKDVRCARCGEIVHTQDNRNLRTWTDAVDGDGVCSGICFDCLLKHSVPIDDAF